MARRWRNSGWRPFNSSLLMVVWPRLDIKELQILFGNGHFVSSYHVILDFEELLEPELSKQVSSNRWNHTVCARARVRALCARAAPALARNYLSLFHQHLRVSTKALSTGGRWQQTDMNQYSRIYREFYPWLTAPGQCERRRKKK